MNTTYDTNYLQQARMHKSFSTIGFYNEQAKLQSFKNSFKNQTMLFNNKYSQTTIDLFNNPRLLTPYSLNMQQQ